MTIGLVTAILLQAATQSIDNPNTAIFTRQASPESHGLDASAKVSLTDETVEIRLSDITLTGRSTQTHASAIKGYSICLGYLTLNGWEITRCTPMRSSPAKLAASKPTVLHGSVERISYSGLPPIDNFWLVLDVIFARRGNPNESHYFVSSQRDLFQQINPTPQPAAQ